MEPRTRNVVIYTDARGRRPFEQWFGQLRDGRARGIIRSRIARLESGNFGDCRAVGEGVQELRIHYGPGFRVYFAEVRDVLIVLLCAGTKGTQDRDIQTAIRYWRDAKETL
jgi:putative addiction module killer protein